MIIIYQHPFCRAAKKCNKLVETSSQEDYDIKNEGLDLSEEKLRQIIKLLACKPMDLIKKSQIIWKTLLKNLDFTDDELIEIIIEYPRLLKSPIIINGNKAVIGRPPELILNII